MATKYTAESITVNKDDRSKLRQTPTMYIPDMGHDGALHIIFEIIDNAIDELMVKNSVGKKIIIEFDDVTKECFVSDDGRGVPLEKLYDVYTVISASGKFDNTDTSAYSYSGGAFGAGSKTAIYLSKWAEVRAARDGKSLMYRFEDGLLVDTKKGSTKEHGTSVRFLLDDDIVGIHSVKSDDIKERLTEKSYVFSALNISFIVKRSGKVVKTHTFGGEDIVDRVSKWKPDTEILRVSTTKEVTYLDEIDDKKLSNKHVIIDLAFAFNEDALDRRGEDENPYLISYANTIKTYRHGSHMQGLNDGLVKYFKQKVFPELKGKDKDLGILPSDVIMGLCAFVTIKAHKLYFRGQHKDQISNPEVKSAVREAVYDFLCDVKPSVIKPYIDFVKRVARGRVASKKVKRKDMSNAFSDERPAKLKEIVQNLKTVDPELILVEGDSAADNAAAARDPYNQAIYSIGRPTNVYDKESDEVSRLKTTFNDVLDYCGITTGDKCNPEDSRVNRILAMTDGDIDGDDIAISVICLIAKHCKPLIDAGMVGRILPPLYSIPLKGDKRYYIRSRREFFDTILKDFIKSTEVKHNGRTLSQKELRLLVEKNFEYDERLKVLADRESCDPKFIEYIAWYYHGDVKSQKKSYWMNKLKLYSGITILMESGGLVLDGEIAGSGYINIALDEHFHKHVTRFKKYQLLNDDIYHYTINGKPDQSLYDIINLMRTYIPDDVKRFKGLGELGPEEMRKLCLDQKNRTVIIFKFDNYEEDMAKLDIIMSTKRAFVEARSNIMYNTRLDSMDLDT